MNRKACDMAVLQIIDYGFDIARLTEEAISFHESYPDLPDNQICVTGTSTGSDHLEGSGSLEYKWVDMETRVPRANPLQETEFTHFLDAFKGTYTEEVYLRLYQRFNIGRLRFMYVSPRKCYSWHRDTTPRIHVPIRTDPARTGLIVEDTVVRLPADGNAYVIDTTRYHTAFNAWNQTRIHLVGALL